MNIKNFSLIAILSLSFSTLNAADHGSELSPEELIRMTYRLADHMEKDADRLSKDERVLVEEKLGEIEDLLRGDISSPRERINCIAKDNDGREPWVMAVAVDPINWQKIEGAQFRSKEVCEDTVKHQYPFKGKTLLCLAKDNDGRDPWVFSIFNLRDRSISHLLANQVPSQDFCYSQLQDARRFREGITVCIAKDRDNREPWVKLLVGYDGSEKIGNESFRSYDECKRSL